MNPAPVTIDLKGCARCEGHHVQLTFQPLTHPVNVYTGQRPLTHWAPCPTNGEPILLVIVPDTEAT